MTGSIGPGLLIFLGIHRDDAEKDIAWLAGKCARLRVFPDETGRLNRSLLDTGYGALVVSQFTLYGNAHKGNRPSFVMAARPDKANRFYRAFIDTLAELLKQPVPSGTFGARMEVRLCNDGPVTIWIERKPPG